MQDLFGNAKKLLGEAVDGLSELSFDNSKNNLGEFINGFVPKKSPDLWYAENEENFLAPIIENAYIRKCLRLLADRYYASQVKEIIAQASLLSEDSYPSIYNIYKQCIKDLRIEKAPELYLTHRLKGINALSIETDNKGLILVGRRTIMMLSPRELAFVLGHELGHYQQGNLVCHTVNGLLGNLVKASDILSPIIIDAIELPMKQWCRQSEFNADRAGYLCCKDLESVHSLFKKVFDTTFRTRYSNIMELYADHPFIKTRTDRISSFARSLEV